MEYIFHLAIIVGIFAVLAISLDLLAGQGGLVSISQTAFYGIGAYTSALLTTKLNYPFFFGILSGIGVAAILSLAISLPALRIKDDYLVVATFGFQIIVFSIFNNWVELTRGPLGIPGIPQPVILGWEVDTHPEFFILATAFAALAYFVVYRLISSPFGRVLHAIREDEGFARAHGKNTLYFKVTAFAVSAALAAMAGSLYAHYITYIDPTSFTVMESILILSMVIIGGAGSMWGPFIGALVLVTLPEALRFIGLPGTVAANLRQIIYGALLVLMMMFRPRGLVGKYGFSK